MNILTIASNAETLDIINKVNSFYHSAWIKLIWVLGGFFTVLSILGPLFINWYQKRQAKIEKENIKNSMKDEIEKLVNNKTEKELAKINKEQKKTIAMTLHVQANYLVDKGNYYLALDSLIRAAENYLEAEEELNLSRVINLIIDILKKDKINKKGLNKLEKHMDYDFEEFINNLSNKTTSALYDKIRKLRAIYDNQ